MNVFAFVFSLVATGLLAALMLAMPSVTPPALPLGVAVPREHLGDPAIRMALRRFRIGVVGSGAVGIVVAAVFAFLAPVVSIVAPVLVFIALSLVTYVVTRRGIRQAKQAGDWYAGVPVRLSADVTASAHHRPPIVWPVLAAVVLVVAAGIGIAVYPHLPDTYAIHRALDGRVDVSAPKSVLAVFSPLAIAAVVAGLLALSSVLAARSALRLAPGDDPAEATAHAAARRGVLATLLSELSAVIAFGFSVLMVLDWTVPDAGLATRLGVIVLVVLIVLVLAATVTRVRRIGASGTARPRQAGHPDSPDDDHYWKAGILYVNRQDPALFVPKRFGLGWTLNLGHPAGAALGILLLLAVVGAITAAAVGAHAR